MAFYIYKKINKMGFETNMIVWLEAVYKEPQTVIKINTIASEPIKLTRGVHQGCALSLLIFDICLEALAIAIRQDKAITGLSTKG